MKFQKIGYDLISTLKLDDNYDELCEAEIEILDKVDKQYGDKDWRYLVDKVIHKFPEWREVEDKAKNGIPISVTKREILSALDKSEDNIKEILSSENDRLSLECELRKHK
ncbi:MAG: SocA family protein [Endomicrobium sp.]|nr:SocA family protein [Endomicrobium sp.]